MNLTPRSGRNEPCPCGSGLKYKVCCLGKDTTSTPTRRYPGSYMAIAVVGVVLAVIVAQTFFGTATPDGSETAPANAFAPTSRPPGPAPAGKVWSPEHGHWHNIGAPGAQAINGGGTSRRRQLDPQTSHPSRQVQYPRVKSGRPIMATGMMPHNRLYHRPFHLHRKPFRQHLSPSPNGDYSFSRI